MHQRCTGSLPEHYWSSQSLLGTAIQILNFKWCSSWLSTFPIFIYFYHRYSSEKTLPFDFSVVDHLSEDSLSDLLFANDIVLFDKDTEK